LLLSSLKFNIILIKCDLIEALDLLKFFEHETVIAYILYINISTILNFVLALADVSVCDTILVSMTILNEDISFKRIYNSDSKL
jgi:hypothetical protein